MNMTAWDKEVLKQQLKTSTEAIGKFKDDKTLEGTKQFEKHVAIINDIKQRVEIITSSEANIKELNEIISKL
jgi:hypothetical protein